MKTFFQRIALWVLAACLLACAGTPDQQRNDSLAQGRDYFPGGWSLYDWGIGQSKENFGNVERAQSEYSPYRSQRVWIDDVPTTGPSATMVGLPAYYPLHVRWKLKDGREFILENIDLRSIMREYFKTHDLQLQWQREGRPFDVKGDYGPMLVHEVKDDTVLIKWVITLNHTPVEKRFTSTGAATQWVYSTEQHLVTTLKGQPTSGIEFSKQWEFKTSTNKTIKE